MSETMQLIRRSQSGDHDAFAALFEQYKNLVYRTAYLTLRHTAEAEDALQEVFIRVYQSLPNYDPAKGAFTTWLYRITMYYCLNQRRKHQVDDQPLDDDTVNGIEATTEPTEIEDLWEKLGQLSEKQRAVVILRFYAELPYAEIAEVLDIPLGTVKSRLDLALKTLRRTLALELSAEMENE